jgi:hypothetical protein
MKPHMEEELKVNIQREILEVPQEDLFLGEFQPFKWYRVYVVFSVHCIISIN